MIRLLAMTLSLALAAGSLRAQVSATKVSMDAEVSPSRILPGFSGKIVLTLGIAPGWHINAHGKVGGYVLPTEFVWTPPPGFTVTEIQYPKAEPVQVSFQDEPLLAYQDEVQIVVNFRVGDTVKPGTVHLVGEITVQACSEDVCLQPSDLEVNVPVDILRPVRLKKKLGR